MTEESARPLNLKERVFRLESQMRRLESGGFGQLRLRSVDGRQELVLRPNGFVVFEDSRPRLSAIVSEDTPRISLLSAEGTPLLGLDAAPDCSALRIFDSAGRPRFEVQVTDGCPGIYFLDEAGERRLEVEQVQGVDIAIYDAKNQSRALFSVSDDGKIQQRVSPVPVGGA